MKIRHFRRHKVNCPAGAREGPLGGVRRGKHFSACKCEFCPPLADKILRAAGCILIVEKGSAFFDSLKRRRSSSGAFCPVPASGPLVEGAFGRVWDPPLPAMSFHSGSLGKSFPCERGPKGLVLRRCCLPGIGFHNNKIGYFPAAKPGSLAAF